MENSYRYLQLNEEMTKVIGESFLLSELDHPLMILDNDKVGDIGYLYNASTGEFTEPYDTSYDIVLTDITQNSETLSPIKPNMYYTEKGEVLVEADCEFKGNIDTSLTTPRLKTPIVRFANGSPTSDEVYGWVEILSGKLTATFELPYSGDWRIEDTRVNSALETFDMDWSVSFEDIHLIV